MYKYSFLLVSLWLATSILLSGCATKPKLAPQTTPALVGESRAAKLLENKSWQLQGKIAFIQKIAGNTKDKRESASIKWQVDDSKHTQELNLTSYLGINVLHLKSTDKQHILKVDGKEYHTQDLPYLIYTLTGLTLPTEALSFWLKGLPYQSNDEVIFNSATQLPSSISSRFNNSHWQIQYNNYQNFNGIKMATKFTIKKNGLLIKLNINNWTLAV